ncbi:DnaT-like ssDNA-binding protein [Acinetobacter variabilis]
MNYVTIESVTTQLGPNWQGDGDANLAVTQANAWLRAKPLRQFEVIPGDVLLAGAYAAQLAAKGELYKDRADGVVKSERVKADTVEVQTEYVAGMEQGKSSTMLFIEDLVAPYISKGFAINTFVVK